MQEDTHGFILFNVYNRIPWTHVVQLVQEETMGSFNSECKRISSFLMEKTPWVKTPWVQVIQVVQEDTMCACCSLIVQADAKDSSC